MIKSLLPISKAQLNYALDEQSAYKIKYIETITFAVSEGKEYFKIQKN
jgi:hypothetical protein